MMRTRTARALRSLILLLGIATATASTVHPVRAAGGADTGSKGAQVYCYMRTAGNGHEVSWNAAYALIKRQGSGMFKPSPEHAAVMITEAVVNDPDGFPECGRHLGALFGGDQGDLDGALQGVAPDAAPMQGLDDRYTY
ncbi:DUF6554 family protein [Synechococcus sp. RSCCF101]|uniref:DUF6554 family protein n=1 Tax=Synechococcus sp. RSCCF101 TaxID=2511069 RepID=UPI001CDA2B4D|nr:DUF6554 family protein [Synechococcus sp. RSCCF101]